MFFFKKTIHKQIKIVAPNEDAQSAAESLYNEYVDYLNKKVLHWQNEMLYEQKKLDSPENYIMESRICSEIDEL